MADTSEERMLGLSNAARKLAEELDLTLSGARQVTRLQIIEALARAFELDTSAAEELFGQLCARQLLVSESHETADETAARFGWRLNLDAGSGDKLDHKIALPRAAATQSSAVGLFQRAIAMRATDIHLEPYGDEVEVRFRIDGQMEHFCRLSHEIGAAIENQFKLMADLDIAEPFHPKEGRIKLPVSLSDHEARITTAHVTGGEAVAIRLQNHRQLVRPLEELGLLHRSLEHVQDLLQHGEGVVLVTGPTGSGKTTTVYSFVCALDNGQRNIVSIEDPVEFSVPSILQMEVDERHDVTFVSGLRTLLRLDPDIVLLGEIRDPETAAVAMRTASSGKYVFSSFHTRDVASTVTGLRDLQIDSRSVAGNIRGIVSQRLVRRLCTACRGYRDISESERQIFLHHGLEPPHTTAIATGCSICRGSGYYGRIGIFEVEANNPELMQSIEHGAPEDEVRQLLSECGGVTLIEDALMKVRDGITSLLEAQTMTWVTFSPRATEDHSSPPKEIK